MVITAKIVFFKFTEISDNLISLLKNINLIKEELKNQNVYLNDLNKYNLNNHPNTENIFKQTKLNVIESLIFHLKKITMNLKHFY